MTNATVSQTNDYYQIWGIRLNRIENNIEIYELVYMYHLANKKYKTKENAIKAINKNGYKFIELDDKILEPCWY